MMGFYGEPYIKSKQLYNALSLQAYNIAKLRLQQSLSQKSDKPKAIITDIDETVLNNSPYLSSQALMKESFNLELWIKWANQAKAEAISGAADFLNYAFENKIEIFYITNRDESIKEVTIKNLQLQGFPLADEIHVITNSDKDSKSKEKRRQEVSDKYDVVLFIGDNLADFSDLFYDKTTNGRIKNVEKNSNLFGDKFIILPNPIYGD